MVICILFEDFPFSDQMVVQDLHMVVQKVKVIKTEAVVYHQRRTEWRTEVHCHRHRHRHQHHHHRHHYRQHQQWQRARMDSNHINISHPMEQKSNLFFLPNQNQ